MKKIRTAALSLITAGALAGGVALAGPAAGSDAYCTAGAPSPEVIYGKEMKRLAFTRAAMTCRSGYMVGDEVVRAPYLPEVIVGMYFEAILQSQNSDGSWTERARGTASGEQEGTIFIVMSSQCRFMTQTNWRVKFLWINASTYGGRAVWQNSYNGRVSSLACG